VAVWRSNRSQESGSNWTGCFHNPDVPASHGVMVLNFYGCPMSFQNAQVVFKPVTEMTTVEGFFIIDG
jgi:hypothetical protein